MGLFIPAFNNLYEIYNRTPLLPYIYRPHIYETSNESIFNLDDYLPQKAFLQLDGSVPITESINADYAAYFGNIENSYFTSRNKTANNLLPIYGTQQQNSLQTVGGRIGVHNSMIKLGASFVMDQDNVSSFKVLASEIAANLPNVPNPDRSLGNVARTKIGVDLTANVEMFTLSAELVKSTYNFNDGQKSDLKTWNDTYRAIGTQFKIDKMESYIAGEDWGKLFYFASLQCNLTSDFFVYGYYSYIESKNSIYLNKGDKCISFGAGYKPNDNIVLKCQYQQDNAEGDLAKVVVKQILLGSSVSF